MIHHWRDSLLMEFCHSGPIMCRPPDKGIGCISCCCCRWWRWSYQHRRWYPRCRRHWCSSLTRLLTHFQYFFEFWYFLLSWRYSVSLTTHHCYWCRCWGACSCSLSVSVRWTAREWLSPPCAPSGWHAWWGRSTVCWSCQSSCNLILWFWRLSNLRPLRWRSRWDSFHALGRGRLSLSAVHGWISGFPCGSSWSCWVDMVWFWTLQNLLHCQS